MSWPGATDETEAWSALERSSALVAGVRRARLAFVSDGLRALLGDPDSERALCEAMAHVAGEASAHVELVVHDGRSPHEISFQVVALGDAAGSALAVGSDVTDRRRREAELEKRALNDALTDLPNRVLFEDRVRQALLVAERTATPAALVLFDLDRFKEVNDGLGHRAGDLALRQVAERVRAQLRASDTVARLSGDEFAILLPPPADLVSALAAARKVADAIDAPFALASSIVRLSASAGVSVFPEHGGTFDVLLDHADSAMYTAKRLRSGIAVYDPDHDLRSPAALSRLGALREAIGTDELALQYQPTVRLRDGATVRMEALVRWRTESGERLRPASFVPLAERGGLGAALGQWVLSTALARCREWRGTGVAAGISVNVTPRELIESEFVPRVQSSLRRESIEPSALTIEISEAALQGHLARVDRPLRELAAIGVRIAIDDFGVGDASLTLLRQLPVSELKLDHAIVRDVHREGPARRFLKSGIDAGHDLGLEITAEGVEDRATADALAVLACDVAQGRYFTDNAKTELAFLRAGELESAMAD